MSTADDERAPRQRPPAQPQHHDDNSKRCGWQGWRRWLDRIDPLGLRWLLLVEAILLALLVRGLL